MICFRLITCEKVHIPPGKGCDWFRKHYKDRCNFETGVIDAEPLLRLVESGFGSLSTTEVILSLQQFAKLMSVDEILTVRVTKKEIDRIRVMEARRHL